MKRSALVFAAVALALLSSLAGCKTAGPPAGSAAGDVAAAPEPRVDVKNEVGENGLLTPAAVLARYVDALGGEPALRTHSSTTTRGTMELPAMGMSGDLVRYAAAPDRSVMVIEMGGFGSMNQGYNGEVGWSDDPMQGARLLEGKELTLMKQQAAYYGPLAYDDLYPTQETVDLAEHHGESAYKVRLVDSDGSESFQFFSEKTGLLIAAQGVQSSQMGDMEVTTLFSDYQDFGGLQLPAVTTIQMMGMEIKTTVSEITYDDVEESAFAPPESIQALLE